MFNNLKKKLASFFSKKPAEEEPEKIAEAPKEEPIKSSDKSKAEEKKEPKTTQPEQTPATKEKPKKELPTDQELKEKAEKIDKEILLEPSLDKHLRGETLGEDLKQVGEKSKKESTPQTSDTKSPTTKEPIKPQISNTEEELKVPKPPEEDKKPTLHLKKHKEQPSFLSKLAKKFSLTTTTLQKSHVDEIFQPIEITLFENNVALEVVDKIKENISKDLVGIEIKKTEIEETILKSLKASILEVLQEPPNLLEVIKKHQSPYTIIFFGINGSGKTTSIAKLAHYLKQNGISVVLAAADTFRAASIEQLETHANLLKIPIIKSQYGSDPASVIFDAKQHADKHQIKVVLADTAGRMYTKTNLIKEMEKIIKVNKPELKIFVGESITGNDAVEQAKTFSEAIGIDGIILSKADIDEKAGTILSVSYITNKPIYFLGTGQDYKDLTPFTKQDILKNIGLE